MSLRSTISSAASILLLSTHALGSPAYRIDALGPANRQISSVQLNNRSAVTVSVYPEETDGASPMLGETFLIEDGLATSLGSLGGLSVTATGINDRAEVVGWADVGESTLHAIRFHNGQLDDLGPVGPKGSLATAINNPGQIVGDAGYPGGIRAFLRQPNGDIVQLGTLGGDSSLAHDINDAGDVVGAARTAEDNFTAFLYRDGAMTNLGTLGGATSKASAINSRGEIVGLARTLDNEQHAAIFSPGGSSIDLAPNWAQSAAGDINDLGQIVGFVSLTPESGFAAALFSVGQPPTLLQDLIPSDSGWLGLFAAGGINNRGQIVGTGLLGGEVRAFLMTPVPEPATIVLGIAVALLIAHRRNRALPPRARVRAAR